MTYWTRQETSILEMAEEESDEETSKHEAHGEQGSVWVDSVRQYVECFVCRIISCYNYGVERVIQGSIQMLVVQDQGMGLEDLDTREIINSQEKESLTFLQFSMDCRVLNYN